MDLTIIAIVVGLPVVVLIAWGMWLTFAALIAKWHGPAGLEAVRHVAHGFRPREWALLIPRQALSSALSVLAATRGVAPAPDRTTKAAIDAQDGDQIGILVDGRGQPTKVDPLQLPSDLRRDEEDGEAGELAR